jgi:hypothetical protein
METQTDTMKELDAHVQMMEDSLASGQTPDPVTVMRLRLLVDAMKAEMGPKRAVAPHREPAVAPLKVAQPDTPTV